MTDWTDELSDEEHKLYCLLNDIEQTNPWADTVENPEWVAERMKMLANINRIDRPGFLRGKI